MFRILHLLLLLILAGPANARAFESNVEQTCAGTVEKTSGNPGCYEIGGLCFFGPGKVSATILAACHERDTCVVRARGDLEPDFYKRVISVDRLCTSTDGSGTTFICPRPPGH